MTPTSKTSAKMPAKAKRQTKKQREEIQRFYDEAAFTWPMAELVATTPLHLLMQQVKENQNLGAMESEWLIGTFVLIAEHLAEDKPFTDLDREFRDVGQMVMARIDATKSEAWPNGCEYCYAFATRVVLRASGRISETRKNAQIRQTLDEMRVHLAVQACPTHTLGSMMG